MILDSEISPKYLVRRKKSMLAQELNISEEEALDRFYNSRTYTFFADPTRGLQMISDRYIVDEILQERTNE